MNKIFKARSLTQSIIMGRLYTLLSVAMKVYYINCYKHSNSFILFQKGIWFSKINFNSSTKLSKTRYNIYFLLVKE